jgi:hypothetical protein
MRRLVSYDDISLPQPSETSQLHLVKPPPKRQRSNQNVSQHWDDPGCSDEAMNYDEDGCVNAPADVGLHREVDSGSRVLTYEEIWDDSALIKAWNTATEEYDVSCFSSCNC